MDIFGVASDTILLCYCLELDILKGISYACPPGLKEILDSHRKWYEYHWDELEKHKYENQGFILYLIYHTFSIFRLIYGWNSFYYDPTPKMKVYYFFPNSVHFESKYLITYPWQFEIMRIGWFRIISVISIVFHNTKTSPLDLFILFFVFNYSAVSHIQIFSQITIHILILFSLCLFSFHSSFFQHFRSGR